MHVRLERVLDGPRELLLDTISADDEAARASRQAPPFANLLTPRARWALWAAARADFERASV